METKVDPLKVLGLPKNYNISMLREAYKNLALKAHPDKGGSEYLFNLVTKCYKYLVADLRKREADKQFYELKKEFTDHKQKAGKQRTKQQVANEKEEDDYNSLQAMFYKGSRFDRAKFNKFFEDNKLKDEVIEQGYKEWMEENKVTNAPQYKGSFNSQGFNQHFEQNAKVVTNNKHLIKYKEPEALIMAKSLNFTELGQDNIDDFSGENKSLKNLNYTDYKLAHTTTRMVDPNTVAKREEFRTVQEFERSREKVQHQMTPEELYEYHMKLKAQEKQEEQRRLVQKAYDARVQQHYKKINGLLTGGGSFSY